MRPSNDEIEELILLQVELKEITKRVDEIKKACKMAGSYFTDKYTISIVTRTRTGLAGLEEVKQFIHQDILNKYNLIRTTDYQLVEIGVLPEVLVYKNKISEV